MAAKTAKTYTLEELKEKAKLALNIPRLVEIVKKAPNHTQARDQAYRYAVEETHDLKDAKKLADSTRFLAILRQSSQEEFEKLITHAEQPKPNAEITQNKHFSDYEFELPLDYGYGGKLLIREELYGGGVIAKSHFVKFEDSIFAKKEVGKFCLEIISALLETSSEFDRRTTPLLGLIQLLEEKCGLKVKVCGNCKYNRGGCENIKVVLRPGVIRIVKDHDSCEHWIPKKVSEKKES